MSLWPLVWPHWQLRSFDVKTGSSFLMILIWQDSKQHCYRLGLRFSSQSQQQWNDVSSPSGRISRHLCRRMCEYRNTSSPAEVHSPVHKTQCLADQAPNYVLTPSMAVLVAVFRDWALASPLHRHLADVFRSQKGGLETHGAWICSKLSSILISHYHCA